MLALVFPGQGSQAVGMLSASAAAVRDTFAEGSDALGLDLWKLAEQGPESELGRTENTQPVLLCASIALYRIWQPQMAERPAMMAGHSLGEYSALVAAGTLDFADALVLVRTRGQLMQRAVPEGEGGMAAVLGLDGEQLQQICDSVEGVVVQANLNAPGQTVLAGERAALQAAIELCQKAGAKRCVQLPVSVPSHSPLMQPAQSELAEHIGVVSWREPQCPVVQNSSAVPERDPKIIQSNLIEQLCSPVRWVESVQAMAASGVRMAVEVGPGKVLSGLGRRIDRSLQWHSLSQADEVAQLNADMEKGDE